MHTFTWDIRGVSASGCTIIYKQYSKIQLTSRASADSAASRDVYITRELLKVHPKAVIVIDAGGVKMKPLLLRFVRACVREDMPESTHTYVVNCPKWADVVYKLAMKLAKPRDRPLAILRHAAYDEVREEIQSI